MRGDDPQVRPRGHRDRASNGTGVTWQRSPCLGKCDRGSAALIQQAGAAVARRDIAPVTPDA